jgi:hypothetical protein
MEMRGRKQRGEKGRESVEGQERLRAGEGKRKSTLLG